MVNVDMVYLINEIKAFRIYAFCVQHGQNHINCLVSCFYISCGNIMLFCSGLFSISTALDLFLLFIFCPIVQIKRKSLNHLQNEEQPNIQKVRLY